MKPMIDTIAANPSYLGEVDVKEAITYRDDKQKLTMDIIMPMGVSVHGGELPAVVFVQGSGWTTPNRLYAFPRLVRLAKRGFVVATVGHTDSQRGKYPFSQFLCDVKSAIRFLRLHADEYHIDSSRIGMWGTSSGANAALLVGMTGDDKRYEDGSNVGASDAVDYVVSCFAATDIEGVVKGEEPTAHPDFVSEIHAVTGMDEVNASLEEVMSRAHDMSPYRIVDNETIGPPVLLLHGDGDCMISFEQSEKLYERMLTFHKDVRLIRVSGGEHEGNFWSRTITDVIIDYICQHSSS